MSGKRVRKEKTMHIYRGESISPGVALGKGYIFIDVISCPLPNTCVSLDKINGEKKLFTKALEQTRIQIKDMIDKVREEIGTDESSIFRAHLAIVNDNSFITKVVDNIEGEKLSALSAVKSVVENIARMFSGLSSPQAQMKTADILDIGRRLIINICLTRPSEFIPDMSIGTKGKDLIFVTRMLLPSQIPYIDRTKILGIISELGNKASHSAVIAKSLGLPVVFGVPDALKHIHNNDEVIVDGSSGIVYVDPKPEIKNEFETIRKKFFDFKRHLQSLTDLPACTTDGCEVNLYANIGAFADVEMALKCNLQTCCRENERERGCNSDSGHRR
jgi:phosphoenolpyruvate-protein kinase (PTS system EI component)